MCKRMILFVLFFGACWGTVEAILGEVLHRMDAPRTAVPLGILAFFILTVARVFWPMPGSSTLIASCAMLFKFTNAPFFGCHLLGIFLLGGAYDLVFLASGHDLLTSRYRIAKNALCGIAATYLGFALFAVTITYVFRHPYWAPYGLPRVLDHVFVSGTLAAVGGAIAVPLGAWIGEILKNRKLAPVESGSWMTTGAISLLTMVLWILAATVSL
jgi:hypothetical protein